MSLPLWMVRVTKVCFPSRFFWARCTRVPVLGHVIRFLAFHRDRIFFLPRNRVVEMNRPIESSGEHAVPTELVERFIRQAKHHWIMDRCICRDSTGCGDYPVELGCLFMGEAALGINPRLGRRVTQEEALEHLRRCQEEGLVHLIGRNRLDTLWLGIGPGERLLTVCHCCPCCCLWKMLPHLDASVGRRVTRLPGVDVFVTERCTGCGKCTEGVCFVDAIRLDGDRAEIGDECRGCGRCVEACPEGAIELRFDGGASLREAEQAIDRLVDIG